MTEGWQRGPLLNFAELVSTGPFGSMLHKSDYVSAGVPLINPTNIIGESIVPDTEKQVGGEALTRLASYVLKAGDVVVGRRGEIGRCAVVGESEAGWVCGTGCFFIRPLPNTDPRFLAWLLRSPEYRGQLERASTGATMKNMSNTTLAELPVVMPAIEEQRRIVAILDEAFEGIATAKANAEKNLQNARELFERHHQAVFAGVGEEAVAQHLGDFATFRNGINYTKQSTGRTVQIIGVKDFQNHFWAPLDDLDSVTLDGDLGDADRVAKDDILTVRSNGNPELIGRCMVVGELGAPVTHSGFTIRIRLTGATSLPTYVCQFLRSRSIRRELIDGGNGLNIKSLNQGMLSEIMVPLPTIGKQREVVAKIESMSLETTRLADVILRKLAALDELKRSLLHQAFTGQLASAKPFSVVQPSHVPVAVPEATSNVIAVCFARHELHKRERTFGHVKAQKLLHLAESIVGIELDRQPMKDAAGPNDFPHMLKAEAWAKAQGFFDMVKRGEGYEFRKLSGFDEHLSRARKALAPHLARLESLIDLLVPMDTQEAEVFTTVHAAWNNLLIDGAAITDDAIVSAAREDWHADKLKIPEQKFRTAITLIRQKNLVPDGTAKYVGGQKSLI
ncbi:MAG: restriction endonuclease subunit S [Burkholderiales bacterium]